MSSQDIKNLITNDPFLYNLFSNDTIHDFKSGRPINWIKIPTSFTSETGKDSSISMMSVYTYTGDECSQISNSIKDAGDIVFSNDGHVAVNFTKEKSQAEFFYPNPTVSENTGGTTGSPPIGIANTVKMQNTNFNTSFFFDDKILFSENLKWILYQLPNMYYIKSKDSWKITQTKTSSTVPIYVLLYNTVHRKNFQEVYGKIINLTDDPFSTQPFIGPNTNYVTTITKYCNAFRVPKYQSPTTSESLYHYSDPACALAFDPQVAKLSQTLSLNLTKDTWTNDFYIGGSEGFQAAIQDLAAFPTSDAYCSRGSGGGPPRFLREKARVMQANAPSDSFMQILANYEISNSGEDSGATFPKGWNSMLPGNTDIGAVCGSKSISFVDCSVTLDTQGSLKLNKTNIRPVCGNKSAAPDNKKPYTPPAKPTDSSTPSDPSSPSSPSDPSSPSSPSVPSSPSSPSSPSVPAVPSDPSTTPTTKPDNTFDYIYLILFLIVLAVIAVFFIF